MEDSLRNDGYWQGRAVLVTGAGGFIGSHLCEELVRLGARVRALVHYNSRNDWGRLETLPKTALAALEVVAGEVTDGLSVKRAVLGTDTVFHLAALIAIPYSYSAPASYVAANVTGTLNVLQACLEAKTRRLVHTSTSEVYGTALYVPIDEKHPLQAQSPYSASKVAADKLAESFFCSYGLPVSTVRPFNTFGPRQSARAVIPAIIAQALAGGPLRLGSLEPVRDFTYVADTVNGFLCAARADRCVGEVVNVGTGTGTTIGRVVARVEEVVGTRLLLVRDEDRVRPDQSEVMRLECDNRKARELMGWAPRVALDDGLRQTVAWMKDHTSLYKAAIYNV